MSPVVLFASALGDFDPEGLSVRLQTALVTVYYVHTDHLGTPVAMSDEGSNVVWRTSYAPFGKVTVDPASTVEMNVRFPGQYYDSETVLHYNYYRYYDPATGRYITADPIGLQGGVNTYGYVGANALIYADPYGLFQRPAPGTQIMSPIAPATAPGTALERALGLLGRTAGGLGLLLTPTTLGDGTLPDNVIPFPGRSTTPPNQCGPEDNSPEDPCERARKTLQGNRDSMMRNLSNDPIIRNRQLIGFARAFNPVVEEHNRVCPGHRVEPIPLGPNSAP